MEMEEKGCLCCRNGKGILLRHYENCGVLQRITQNDVTQKSHFWMSRQKKQSWCRKSGKEGGEKRRYMRVGKDRGLKK